MTPEQADGLRAARQSLAEAVLYLEKDLECLIECHTKLAADGTPIIETLEFGMDDHCTDLQGLIDRNICSLKLIDELLLSEGNHAPRD